MIDVDTIFARDREHPPAERSLPWEESRDGLTVVIEPKPHWASDMLAFRLTVREYCYYRDWLRSGAQALFFAHAETNGDQVVLKARAEISREIANGLWR